MMKRAFQVTAVLVAAALGAAACDRAAPVEDRELAGAPAEVFSIGMADGADEQTLGHVSDVAFDGDDNLYVLDGAAGRIMAYAPDGTFLRSMGRPGPGPGELTRPMQLRVLADGRVAVADLGHRGFSIFGADGAFQHLVAFESDRGVAGLELRVPLSGALLTAYQPVPGRDPDELAVELVRVSSEGGAPTTVYRVPPGEGTAGILDPRAPAFAPRVHWGVMPDGRVVVTHGTEYVLRYVAADGSERRIARAIPPRRVTETDRTREREQRMEAIEHHGASLAPEQRAAVTEAVRNLQFASVMQTVNGLLVDPAGWVWVHRTSPTGERNGPIDLFSPEGEYVGTVQGMQFPLAVSPSGLAAWLVRDELEVERVVVRRLPSGWKAATRVE